MTKNDTGKEARNLQDASLKVVPMPDPRLDPERAIADAEWLYQDYIRELRAHFDGLEARQATDEVDDDYLKAAVTAARTVRQAIHMLMEERGRIDKYRKQIAGDPGGCLDLDAARDEIGRRLACLRRAGQG